MDDTRTLGILSLRTGEQIKNDINKIKKRLSDAGIKKVPKRVSKEDYLIYARRIGEFAKSKGIETGFIEMIPYRVGYLGKTVSLLRQHIRGIRDTVWAAIVAENIEIIDTDKNIQYPFMSEPSARREILLRIARNHETREASDDVAIGPYNKKELETLLFETFQETQEIIVSSGIRSTGRGYRIVTMNTSGNIDTLNASDGSVIQSGNKPSVVALSPGLHSFRSQPTSQSRISKDLPRGIILFFVQDFMEAVLGKKVSKTVAKGIMCRGNAHPIRFRRIANYILDYITKERSDLAISEELRLSILPKGKGGNGTEIFHKNHLMTCIIMEALTRHSNTYRPPQRSDSTRPK